MGEVPLEVMESRRAEGAKRDMEANMQAWPDSSTRRADMQAREDAREDRLHSAGDCEAAAADRSALAEEQPTD